jgi:hypothetical protein
MSSKPIVVGSPYHELIRTIPLRTKAGLVVEVLSDYCRVRWLLWRRDVRGVLAELRGSGERTTDVHRQAVGARLGQAVIRTLACVPFDSRCLARSLVLTSMLSRRGIDSVLIIGVKVEPAFSAHAWVESGGRPLLPPLDYSDGSDGSSRLVEL